MLDEYQSLIDELLSTPGAIREAVAAADADEAEELYRLVSVLNARDELVLARILRMQTQGSAHLTVLPELDVVLDGVEVQDDRTALLERFDTNRGELVSRLINFTLADWAKEATHDAGGHVGVVDEIEEHVEFDEAIRARIGR